MPTDVKLSLVRTILERELSHLGFKKRRACFVRVSGGITVFVWIQRAQSAPRFFIEMGAVYEGGPPVSGGVADWHVRERAESRITDPAPFRAALDESTPLSLPRRVHLLKELIRFAETNFLACWGDERCLFDVARKADRVPRTLFGPSPAFRKFVALHDEILLRPPDSQTENENG